MLFDNLLGVFSNDMGIDLGTANTLIHVRGEGIVLCEPSVVAVHAGSRKVLAVGEEAKQMLGRTPKDIMAILPMRDGVIADFDIVEEMIRYFIKKVHQRNVLVRPRVVIGIPAGITEVERRAVKESAEQAGAREIHLIEESFAAAIGADITIEEPAGHMVIDIGGGTTEVSVISLGGMVISNSIRIGGNKFDETLIQYMKKEHGLIIGERTAEDVKIKLGNAYPEENDDEDTMEIRGRDSIKGLPEIISLSRAEIRDCFSDILDQIFDVVKETLDHTPAELHADISEKGMVMTGGGSLLKGLPKFLARETGVPVLLADRPLECVALGTGKFLDQMDKFRDGIFRD